jgi:hypothetical protein
MCQQIGAQLRDEKQGKHLRLLTRSPALPQKGVLIRKNSDGIAAKWLRALQELPLIGGKPCGFRY